MPPVGSGAGVPRNGRVRERSSTQSVGGSAHIRYENSWEVPPARVPEEEGQQPYPIWNTRNRSR